MLISASIPLSYTPFTKTPHFLLRQPKTHLLQTTRRTLFTSLKSSQFELTPLEEEERDEEEEERSMKFRWFEIGPNISEAQEQDISQLPPKMSKRCRALMKQLICFNIEEEEEKEGEESGLGYLLQCWVKIMKPKRADWLLVLKEMSRMQHPLLYQVTEFALLEESFEANIRDYTKIIHSYAKLNRLQDAENAFQAMKIRGFICDQVTLTVLLQMYSKAGNLNQAEEIFEDIKLLGLPLDKRAYGSMIMAYIRAELPALGEELLIEMDAKEIYAGKEVYKALLRAYSSVGDTQGAQRVFDAIQFAGIHPDVKLCALLINAYGVAGQTNEARIVFENLRSVGLKPSDKCVAVMLAVYEKDDKLSMALDLLIDLEKDGIMAEQEASEVLLRWFRRLGVVEEVALVLSEYSNKESSCRTAVAYSVHSYSAVFK